MERLQLLKGITFGQRVAEDETNALGKYFVETDQWDRIFKGEIDVVRGDKGSGKSAIYSLLVAKSDDLFDKRILLTTAERPRGATVFNNLVSDPPTTEQDFINLWKLYIVTIVGQKVKEFDLSGPEASELIGILEDQKLLEKDKDFDLARIFKAVRQYVSKWAMPKAIEGSVSLDPVTMLPTLSGKITPAEPDANERSKGFISIERLAELANAALTKANYHIWVLLDRLDVAFVDSHDLEKNALRALFRVYRDFGGFERIKLKIFLRSDIWDRIVEGGFREASHITRVAVLNWKPASLLNLIIKRVLNNEILISEFKIDGPSVLRDFEAQNALFYKFFPKQVEQGTKKRTTLDWMISRCADATERTAPRELIHLLNSVREEEVVRIERGESPPAGDQLFDYSVFKPALATVSEARLIQTIYAEFPDLKSFLVQLEGQKTEQTSDSLSTIWDCALEETKRRIALLIEIGFFQERGTGDNLTYWVPFLYRDALFMSQGLADD